MPRDLFADQTTFNGMPQLSREPAASAPPARSGAKSRFKSPSPAKERSNEMAIHPFVQLLSQDNLDDCDWLEHAAFDPIEAATREKIDYRLHLCGELCSGVFSSDYPTTSGPLGALIKARSFPSIDSNQSDRKQVLLGHIIATRSNSPLVTDASMDYPKDWQTNYQFAPSTGHNEEGQTICLHSLCVHPDFQGKGLASMLLRSYVQRMKDSGVAKRIALLCRDRLVGFYEKAGFKKVGPSKCQYGGGNWMDMVIDLQGGGSDHDHEL